MAAFSRRALLQGRPEGRRVPRRLTQVASPEADRGELPDATLLDPTWLRVHRTAMACRVEVVIADGSAEVSRAAIGVARTALDEADRLEAMLTVFRETSQLVRLNRHAADHPVAVSRELYDLLEHSVALHRATGGAFDISSTPLSRCWGFLRRQGRLPLPAELDRARTCVDMESIVLDRASSTVFFRRQGLELNLGAIGKGYVLDRMAALISGSGVRQALVSASRSSVIAIGSPADGGGRQGWRVDLRSMVRDEVIGRVMLRDGAIGTSGSGEQFFEVDGVRYGHVIDPRSGWPAAGVRSASVIARTAADADALSTAFLVGGLDLARAYCATHSNVLAVVTPDAGAPQVVGSYPGATVELG